MKAPWEQTWVAAANGRDIGTDFDVPSKTFSVLVLQRPSLGCRDAAVTALAAAAPDLYRALAAARDALTVHCAWGNWGDQVQAQADAALRKARGET